MLTSDLCTQHSLCPGNASFWPWFLFSESYSKLVHNATSLEILPSSSSSGYCGLNSQINPVILYNTLEDLGECFIMYFKIKAPLYGLFYFVLISNIHIQYQRIFKERIPLPSLPVVFRDIFLKGHVFRAILHWYGSHWKGQALPGLFERVYVGNKMLPTPL